MLPQQPAPARAGDADVQGFVVWAASLVCLGAYLCWAYLPDEVLHSIGVYYYPDRYWAVAVPIYACVCTLFVIVFYVAVNMMMTPPLSSLRNITDEHAREEDPQAQRGGRAVPPIADLDIRLVSRTLHCS
eukprot:tig00020610_g11997.t1